MISLNRSRFRFALRELVIVALITMVLTVAGFAQPTHTTVVVSLDGFRWDYADRFATPNLDRIAEHGVKANSMIPSFPSTTFANHYTLATGLYPDHHGIVLNSFYASDLDRPYNMRNRSSVEDGAFYGGEPIWNTAEKQGVSAAILFWVGSEADIQGMRPTRYNRYDHDFPYAQRIDTVTAWLRLPESERPGLVMFYFDEPDGSGHHLGPENDSIGLVIHYLDSLLGVFLNRMLSLPHADQINFIVVSDHGMGQLYPDKVICPDQYIDTSWVEIADGWNPVMNLKAREGFVDSIYFGLKRAGNLNVWRRGESPAHLNHGTNPRWHDITVVADSGWSLYWSWDIGQSRGTHGYDIQNIDMHAIFYAMGPDFKQGYLHPSFQNIHVYPLLARLLGVVPAKTDGDIREVMQMLLNP